MTPGRPILSHPATRADLTRAKVATALWLLNNWRGHAAGLPQVGCNEDTPPVVPRIFDGFLAPGVGVPGAPKPPAGVGSVL